METLGRAAHPYLDLPSYLEASEFYVSLTEPGALES